MAPLIVVGGGARSGKSAFALARAGRLGDRRAFIATAEALDDEMRDRVRRHAGERGPSFRTYEEPYEIPELLATLDDVDVAVIDCLTLWLANLLVRGDSDLAIDRAVADLVKAVQARPFACVVVTNEVGMGIVPDSALGRRFRDIAGRAHQRLAHAATEIHFAVLGCIVRLRPLPVDVQGALLT